VITVQKDVNIELSIFVWNRGRIVTNTVSASVICVWKREQ